PEFPIVSSSFRVTERVRGGGGDLAPASSSGGEVERLRDRERSGGGEVRRRRPLSPAKLKAAPAEVPRRRRRFVVGLIARLQFVYRRRSGCNFRVWAMTCDDDFQRKGDFIGNQGAEAIAGQRFCSDRFSMHVPRFHGAEVIHGRCHR
ncbi:hypothetical protein EJB05_52693, partial [Eragrostis curvula]